MDGVGVGRSRALLRGFGVEIETRGSIARQHQ